MNIRTSDTKIQIHYNGQNLSGEEADKINDVWNRCGNR